MDIFETLEREIKKICKINNVEYEWSHNCYIGAYIINFTQQDKVFTVIVTEKDLFTKPFDEIKSEVERAIYAILIAR